MEDNAPPIDPIPEPVPEPAPRRGVSRKTRLILLAVLLTPLLLFALYTMMVLSWSYSDGWRSGIVQKFSRKGYICKTWEGELAMTTVPGVAPTIWQFSVRDDRTAQQISDGIGERMDLHYEEKRGVPTDCFGATDYYVDSVRVSR
jgi:hypothetical protein